MTLEGCVKPDLSCRENDSRGSITHGMLTVDERADEIDSHCTSCANAPPSSLSPLACLFFFFFWWRDCCCIPGVGRRAALSPSRAFSPADAPVSKRLQKAPRRCTIPPEMVRNVREPTKRVPGNRSFDPSLRVWSGFRPRFVWF